VGLHLQLKRIIAFIDWKSWVIIVCYINVMSPGQPNLLFVSKMIFLPKICNCFEPVLSQSNKKNKFQIHAGNDLTEISFIKFLAEFKMIPLHITLKR